MQCHSFFFTPHFSNHHFQAKKRTNESAPTKLERMQALPVNDDATPSASSSVDLNSVWNTHNHNDHNIPILNERCSANETTARHACHLFEVCVSNFTRLVEEVEQKLLLKSGHIKANYDPVRLHHSWHEFVTIQVAFYGGLFLGTLFGAIMLFTMKMISDCVTTSDDERPTRRTRSKCEW